MCARNWLVPMLFLTRKTGQAVIINDQIEVNVIEISGKTVKLGFKFPPTETVLRQELYEKIKQETKAAAQSTNAFSHDNVQDIENKLHKLQHNVSKSIISKDKIKKTGIPFTKEDIDTLSEQPSNTTVIEAELSEEVLAALKNNPGAHE